MKEKIWRSENPIDGDQGYEIYDGFVPQKTEIILDTDSGLVFFFLLHFSKGNKYFWSYSFPGRWWAIESFYQYSFLFSTK